MNFPVFNSSVFKNRASILLAFFLLNFLLKFLFITSQDICIDEPYSIFHAQFGIGDIIRFLKPTNNPPLFEIILHFWIKIFGIEPVSVRFLPVLFGSLTVIFIYRIAERLFEFEVALTASLLYTFSTISIFYSHDCRVYTLFLLLTTMSVYLFILLLEEESGYRNKFLFCLVNILIIYSHYFGFIVWCIEGVYILIYKRKNIKRLAMLFGLSLVFYLPQILIFLERFRESSARGTWIKEIMGIEDLYNRLWSFCNMPVTVVLCLLILAGALAKKIYLRFIKKSVSSNESQYFKLIFVWFFMPFFLMFIVSFWVPIYLERYLIFIAPAFYILMAYLITFLVSDQKRRILAILVLVVSFMSTNQLDPDKKREPSKVVEFVRQKKDSNTLVIVCAQDFISNFAYYYDKKIFTRIDRGDEYGTLTASLNKENIYPVSNIGEIEPGVLRRFKTVMFVDAAADFSCPGNGILKFLEHQMTFKQKQHFISIFDVYVFVN